MPKNLSILLLAAGASRRMGQAKQLLPIGNTTLIRHTLQKCLELQPQNLIVVTGANAPKIELQLMDLPITIVRNNNWKEGMGTSVARGIAYLQKHFPDSQAVLLLVCDQPYLSVDILIKIIEVYEKREASIIASNYGEDFGVPALFDKKWFSALVQLEGDRGAKKIMKKHQEEMELVDFPEGIFDLDRPEDYERWLRDEST